MPIYYLSFQRAPPIQVSPNDLISISPTIVNDLRDEVYQPDQTLEITFAWIGRIKSNWKKLSEEIHYSWEGPRSAYKLCEVKVPSKVSLGDVKSIHLALWISDIKEKLPKKRRRLHQIGTEEWVYNIQNLPPPEQDCPAIIPVLSAAVEIVLEGTKSGKFTKSSSTSRLFQLGSSAIVEICEEAGFELDKHIWDASLYLAAYISRSLLEGGGQSTLSPLTVEYFRERLNVIELGAGTGMVTISFSALLAQASNWSAEDKDSCEGAVRLIATDVASAIPLLERNININRDVAGKCHIECHPLDWSDESQIKETSLILVSDCTYNPTYFKPFCSTIQSLLIKGKQSAICLLAKKHRHRDEEQLWKEIQEHDMHAVLLEGQQDVQKGHWGLWKLHM